MDGELSRETGLFMARRLSTDDELCAAWQRYHLIRDCIRQPGGAHTVVDLSARLRDRLEQEFPDETGAERQARWLRPVAGLAIAASVALMAVTLVGPERAAGPKAAPAASPVAAASFTSPNTMSVLPAMSQPVSYSVEDRDAMRRLNSYLVRHNQMSGSTGRQGFVSFVPILSIQVATPPATQEGDTTPATDKPSETAQP